MKEQVIQTASLGLRLDKNRVTKFPLMHLPQQEHTSYLCNYLLSNSIVSIWYWSLLIGLIQAVAFSMTSCISVIEMYAWGIWQLWKKTQWYHIFGPTLHLNFSSQHIMKTAWYDLWLMGNNFNKICLEINACCIIQIIINIVKSTYTDAESLCQLINISIMCELWELFRVYGSVSSIQ